MSSGSEKSADLLRGQLASIGYAELKSFLKDEEKITDKELKDRAAAAEIFYKNHFKRVLAIFIHKQLKEIAGKATNNEMLQFSRGTINGLYLIKEWFKDESLLSLSRYDENKEDKPVEEQINPLDE